MSSVHPNEVHIGREILKRFSASGMSKSEFGRRIDVSQQHVNRIFEKGSIDTDKLSRISDVLGFNFFTLYCDAQTIISATSSAVSIGNHQVQNNIGDSTLLSQLAQKDMIIENAKKTEVLLNAQIEQLQASLKDKELIINLLNK